MLIWKGHGLLIPVFAVAGAFLGTFGMSLAATALKLPIQWIPVAGAWAGALLVLIYARTFGKTVNRPMTDSHSGRTVMARRSHAFFFIPSMAWAVILILLAAASSVAAFLLPKGLIPGDLGNLSPGQQAFHLANLEITTNQKGAAHGNRPEAEELAATFSTKIREVRELSIETSKPGAFSLTKGDFVTHCQLSPDACVFLVHVPGLRDFSDSSKDFISQAAWEVAIHTLSSLPQKPPTLVVGIRGALLYDRVLFAKTRGGNLPARPLEQHTGPGSMAGLYPYFEEKPEEAGQGEAVVESVPSELPTPVRDWKSTDGRVLRASLQGFTNAAEITGRFKREDGTIFDIAIGRFSPGEQSELRRLHGGLQGRKSL